MTSVWRHLKAAGGPGQGETEGAVTRACSSDQQHQHRGCWKFGLCPCPDRESESPHHSSCPGHAAGWGDRFWGRSTPGSGRHESKGPEAGTAYNREAEQDHGVVSGDRVDGEGARGGAERLT